MLILKNFIKATMNKSNIKEKDLNLNKRSSQLMEEPLYTNHKRKIIQFIAKHKKNVKIKSQKLIICSLRLMCN